MSETLRKLLPSIFSIFAQFPALGAIWHQWELVKQHPIITVSLTLLYEGALAALAFGREVWREEFKKEAIKATAGWVRALPSKFAPGFRKRYNQRLLIEEGTLNLRGLVTKAAHRLNLNHVFVDLKISNTSNPNQLSFDPIITRELANTRSIWDFIRQSKDKSGDAVALVIIGPPGSGKSTLMQYITLTLAANRQRSHRLPAYIPILLRLRKHGTAIVSNPKLTLGELVTKHFSSEEYEDLHTSQWWFGKQLKAGRCLVMLDGLDEVADPKGRRIVSAWADKQIKKYPRCRFVITSRPRGYKDAPLELANVVEVQLFNADQITRFIKGWYLESETVSNGHVVDQGVKLRANREAKELLKSLQTPQAQAINALTANPLLLTMIAMVHCFRGRLPRSRVELYREICEVLLGRWRQVAGMQERMTADQKRDVLAPLAAWMMKRENTEITTDEARQIIEQPLSQVGMQGIEIRWFLSDLHDNSGLVLEREVSTWSFVHKTFQEYLTATHWLTERMSPNWAALVKHDWWYETLRLYAMQGDATPILQACLNEGSVPALTLAAEIIEEGPRKLDQTVRADVYRCVDGALEDPDPDLRRLAAEVKLSQRLKKLHSLDHQKGVAIDLEYVTCAEYQLFLDEMRRQGRYHQPDHWINLSFPSGQGDKPVSGVRANDAKTFCDWLTRRQGGNARYCLPSLDEAQAVKPAEDASFLATWCRVGEDFCLTLLTEAKEQENRQKLLSFSATKLPLPSPLSSINARDHVRDLARPLALALDTNRNHARALALDIDRALAIARAHARARALDSTFDSTLVRARARVRERDRERDRTLVRALDIDRTLGTDRTLDIAVESDSGTDRALESAIDIAFHIAFDITIDIIINLDRALAPDISIDNALDRACTLAEAIDSALDTSRTPDIPRALDRALESARALERALESARESARALARNRNLERALVHTRALDGDGDRDRDRDRDLALARALALARVLESALESALARDRDLALALKSNSVISSPWLVLLANLLADQLALITARTASKARQAQRQCVARIIEYLYSLVVESTSLPWWPRWWRFRRVAESRDTNQRALLEYYWWLQIMMAREAGALSTWEGIRIVRKSMESTAGEAPE